MTFSITDAAFEGFRLMKRAPMAVLMWGLTYLVCLTLIVVVGGAAIVSLIQATEGANNDPQAALGAFGSIATLYALSIPLFLIAAGIVVAATCRAVFTPQSPGFFYMKLGGAELRLMAAYLCIGLGFIVAMVVVVMLFGLIAGGAVMMQAGAGADQTPPLALALIYPLYFGMIALYVWVSVRLSLVGPITVAEGRFAIGRSWAATKGRFWTLLDLAAAAIVRWFLVYFAMIVLVSVLTLAAMGMIDADAFASAGRDPGDVLTALLPIIIGFVVLIAAFSAIQFAVLSTPFAVFYRDVIAVKPSSAAPISADTTGDAL